MRLLVRWGVAVVVSASGFVLAWWVCAKLVKLDAGASLGIAGAVVAIVMAIATWWAPQGVDGGGADGNAAGGDHVVVTAGKRVVVNVGGADTAEPGVPGTLPREVPGFTGREKELAGLAALATGGRVVVSVIDGTPGVGKTALAVHAAHRLLDAFPDGQLYADLHGYTDGQNPAEPGEVLTVFLRRLGVPAEEIPAELEERSGLLRQVLAVRRVLMVLDNARTETQVRPLLPGAGGSLVLVTSRSVLPGLEADKRISLDILPVNEAAAMLAQVIGANRAEVDLDAVAEVARLCGWLPLALRIAGQLLAAHPAWPVARLVEVLAEERKRLARLGAGDLQVRAAFGVSYAQLAGEDARLFRLLGLHPGPDFTADSAAALAGTEAEAAGLVLDRLAGVHLVTEDAAGRFGMHDLLRLYARATCQDTDSPADREAAESRLVSYYVDLAGFLDSCADAELRRAAAQAAQRAGKVLPSTREARAMFQAERLGLLAAFDLAVQRGWEQQVHQLSCSTQESLTVPRYLDDLLTVHQAALAAARRARDRGVEGIALGNLGNAYRELRQFEQATDCLQQALTIHRKAGDRHREGMALNNLGLAYHELRQFKQATDHCQQALALFRKPGDRHGLGGALNNLGTAYQEQRQFERAIDHHQQALALYQEAGDRHGEGGTLINLGLAHHELRQFKQAAACWRAAAVAMREAGDHEEATRLKQLAESTQARRRWRLCPRPSS
jgi:tetratricopeptide (TPR) repeat protein